MVTMVTTTTTVVMLQQAIVIVVLGVVVLIASVIAKELLSSTQGKTRANSLARRLNMVTLPLLFAFTVSLATKIWELI